MNADKTSESPKPGIFEIILKQLVAHELLISDVSPKNNVAPLFFSLQSLTARKVTGADGCGREYAVSVSVHLARKKISTEKEMGCCHIRDQ